MKRTVNKVAARVNVNAAPAVSSNPNLRVTVPTTATAATAQAAAEPVFRTAKPTASSTSTPYMYGAANSGPSALAISSSFESATSLSATARPGGRSSSSLITATVFGCTGFVGRYVVNHLGRIGSQVICPYRGDGFNTRHLKLNGDLGQIIPLPYDAHDTDSVHRSISKSNVVVNLIGSVHDTSHYTVDDSNVKLTYQLCKAAAAAGVERFIHVSHINADTNSSSKFFRAKGEAEQIVKHFFPTTATILRPSSVFGHEDKLLRYYAKLVNGFSSTPVCNDGEKIFTPVHVLDVARAVMQSIVSGDAVGNTYTLTGPDAYTEAQLVALVAKHIYREHELTRMPDMLATLYGNIISGDRSLPFAPVELNALLNKFRVPNWFDADKVQRSKYNEVIDSTYAAAFVNNNSNGNSSYSKLLTFADLNITPVPVTSQIDTILLSQKQDRGPDRYLAAEEAKSSAHSL